MFCYFCHTRNGSVTHHSILRDEQCYRSLRCSPERFDQNEEAATGNKARSMNELSFVPKNIVNRNRVKPCIFATCNRVFVVLCYLILMKLFINLSLLGSRFRSCIFCYSVFRRRGNKLVDVHICRFTPAHFLSKMEKMQFMREQMKGNVFFSRHSRQFFFVSFMMKIFFPLCNLTWHVNTYVSRQRKGINSRNESTFWLILVVAPNNTLSSR